MSNGMMNVKIVTDTLAEVQADVLAVGMFEEESTPEALAGVDVEILAELKKERDTKNFVGEFKTMWGSRTFGKLNAARLFVVGLGKKAELTPERVRRVSGFVTKAARDSGAKTLALSFPTTEAQAIVEGALLGHYQFTEYKTVDKDKIKTLSSLIIITDAQHKTTFEQATARGRIIADAVISARNLVNGPPVVVTPTFLGKEAERLAKECGFKATVYDKAGIEKLGFNLLLAVAKGSTQEPRFIVMDYNPAGAKKTLAFVGKGITFDSGGLDIKMSPGMETMKCDMAGAAAVISSVAAIARLKLPMRVLGIIPSCENMPSGPAYKAGDIIKAYNGKTVEIFNTDAEGRLVLGDALSYAETLNPDAIVDLATLTGACVVALGMYAAGLFGNNDAFVEHVKAAGEATGDRAWPLPLWDEYKELVKSDVADIRNTGKSGRCAGAITGAAFLANFVEKTPWAHIDIAGPAYLDEAQDYNPKYGTGFGVRLLVELAEKWV